MNNLKELFTCFFIQFFHEKVSSQIITFKHALIKTEYAPALAAAEIANNKFVLHHGTIILGEDDTMIETDCFLKAYTGNIILHNNYSYSVMQTSEDIIIKQFVIFLGAQENLQKILQFISGIPYFDHTGWFIIVCAGDNTNKCVPRDIFRVCWHHLITNVVLLRQASTRISVLTYYPYGPGACGKTESVVIFEWKPSINSSETIAIYLKKFDLYPEKFLNLFGCIISFAMYNLPPFILLGRDDHGRLYLKGGPDAVLLWILAKYLNMTIKIVTPTDGTGSGYYNGTKWLGSLGLIFDGKANITIATILSPERNEIFHSSISYRIIQLVWAAPPPSLAAPWTKVILPFDMYTWFAFFTTYGLVMFSLYAVRRHIIFKTFRILLGKKMLPDNLILNAWAIITGNAITKMPRRIFAVYFVSLWLLFSFFIRNSYQGALVGIIKKNIYSKSFRTIYEAIQAGYSYGGVAVANVFANNTDLFKQFREIKENEKMSTLNEMINGSTKFMLALGIEQAEYFRDVNGIFLDILPGRIVYMPVVFYARRFSPLFRVINGVMERLTATGIPRRPNVLQMPAAGTRWQGEEALGFSNLACAFYIIVMGWLVSLIAFTMEIVFFCIKK